MELFDLQSLNPPANLFSWNSQKNAANSALQRFSNNRRKQKAQRYDDQITRGCGIKTPISSHQNSQVTEDSQNFAGSSQSQSPDSRWNQQLSYCGNPYISRNKYASQTHLHNPGADYGFDAQIKKELHQNWQAYRQEEKENEEREMLQNFLSSAKKCCEEANNIASKAAESDKSIYEAIMKMKEHLEATVPNLIEKIIENHEIKFEELKTVLQQKDEKIAEVEKKLLDATTEIVKSINETNTNQKNIEEIVSGIRENLNKPKPMLCEMACQYSPQVKYLERSPKYIQAQNRQKTTRTNRHPLSPLANHSHCLDKSPNWTRRTFENTSKQNIDLLRTQVFNKKPELKLDNKNAMELSFSDSTVSENQNRQVDFRSGRRTKNHAKKLVTTKSEPELRKIFQNANDEMSMELTSADENDAENQHIQVDCTSNRRPKSKAKKLATTKPGVVVKSYGVMPMELPSADRNGTENQRNQVRFRSSRRPKSKVKKLATEKPEVAMAYKSGSSGSWAFAPRKPTPTNLCDIIDDSDVQPTQDSCEVPADVTLFSSKAYNRNLIMETFSDSDESDYPFNFTDSKVDPIYLR